MSITVKHLGFVTCFNGINITQTKHTSNFMQPLIWWKCFAAIVIYPLLSPMPRKLPPSQWIWIMPTFMISNPLHRHPMKSYMRYSSQNWFYLQNAIGKLHYAVITVCPNISFLSIKLSQYSTCPAQIHFLAVRQLFYIFITLWLPEGPLLHLHPDKITQPASWWWTASSCICWCWLWQRFLTSSFGHWYHYLVCQRRCWW